MKRIHSFTIEREQDVVRKETTENEKGEKVTIEKTFVEKIPQYLLVRKPTRKLYDEAELYYAITLSEGIKKGLLTKALLAKRYENDGGSLSEPDIERFGEMYVDFYEKQTKFVELKTKQDGEEELTEEELESMAGLEVSLKAQRSALTHFEMEQQSLYEQTAEVRARNKTILWWVLHLSMTEDEKGKTSDIFEGKTFDQKLEFYDEKAELEDEYWDNVLQKFTYFVSFWFVGRVNDEKEFKKLIDEQMADDDLQDIWKEQEEEESDEKEAEVIKEEVEVVEEKAEENTKEAPEKAKPAEEKPKAKKKKNEKKDKEEPSNAKENESETKSDN